MITLLYLKTHVWSSELMMTLLYVKMYVGQVITLLIRRLVHPVALIMTSLYIKPTCGRKNIYTTWYFRQYFDDIINNSKGKYFKKEENETEDIMETSFNLKCKFNTGSENKTINLKKKNSIQIMNKLIVQK